MTAKEYLEQAWTLDQRINWCLAYNGFTENRKQNSR